MRIRALMLLRGAEVSADRGDIVTVADALGQVLIEAGAAIMLDPPTVSTTVPPEAEVAVLDAPENTMIPAARSRRPPRPGESVTAPPATQTGNAEAEA